MATAWEHYLPDRAAELAERITSLPESCWENDPALLVALAATFREAPDSNHFAALAYLDAASRLIEARPDLLVLVALGRARSMRGLGRLADARAQALVARQLVAAAPFRVGVRLDLEARTLFEEGACLALMGELDAASRQIRHGLGLAGALEVPGLVEARGWLVVVDYFLGGAADASRHLAAVPMGGGADRLEVAPALLADALVALDDGEHVRAGSTIDRLEAIAGGTEFEAFVLQLRAMSADITTELERLDVLRSVVFVTHDWQSPALLRALHDGERVAALIRLGSFGAARDAVAGLPKKNPLHTRHADCPAVAPARLALHSADHDGVLELTAPCRAMGDRHAPRSLAAVEVLRAAAHDALGDAITAGETFDRVLMQAARTGWRRHFQVIPPTRLAGMLEDAAARPQPPESREVLDVLAGAAVGAAPDIAPLSSRERIVLARIAAGETRRQISSQLRVSPNTVKAQVRSIYRKLGASNRHEALDRAARFGLAD
ncbi:LuxR C-terminal-related transcriptional regulator [Leifsonia sp. H3M29-4]|uniref:helix-turn-helix transcriptional regulator n=1 Tax=Salinibacterium metalliresistens TaxID=3031321 RepID=UPI0023DCB269|nr:LuxR C-terminal-related transcriptional regulator [Salinibacterium metalliresistens]MDF1477536.1 LuxR C-terminal-related transcriptional regulator [Salinibacterium metalliresistens]